MTESAAGPARASWSPLRHPVFRSLWLASSASSLGTWMNDVGAAWLMTELTPSPLVVSLVPASTTLPVLLVALPAGALADIADKRKVLIAAQGWMLASAAALGILTITGATTAGSLLALTFCLGLGGAFTAPAWQSMIPELVPREELWDAITLGGLSINLSRAVGPVLGGLVVARLGPGAVFLLNAVSFTGVLWVLWHWRREVERSALPAERFLAAIRTGGQFVRHSPDVHAVLVRAALFALPTSALWALLPLYTRQTLGGSAIVYGAFLGLLGAGAVTAALSLRRLRFRFGGNLTTVAAAAVMAAALAILAAAANVPATGAAAFLAGLAWLTSLSSLQTAAQQAVPGWVRARAMAFYLLVLFGSLSVGSVLWGALAEGVGLRAAFGSAAGLLVAGLLAARRFPLLAGEPPDLAPSRHWPTPVVAREELERRQPVAVSIVYRVEPGDADRFLDLMGAIRRVRLRDGALRWDLYQDPEDPGRFVEIFVSGSWSAHLRQHERVTVSDRELFEAAHSYHQGSGPPDVTHWVGVRYPRPRTGSSGR